MVDLLNKLILKRKKKSTNKVDTVPLRNNENDVPVDETTNPLTAALDSPDDGLEAMVNLRLETSQLMASCAQSNGIIRDHNEDALFCLTTMITGNGDATPFGIYIVADGMGGHVDGEIASEIAVRTMASHIVKDVFSNLIAPNPQPPNESLQEILTRGIHKAHENVIEKARGVGTTLTAVTIFSKQMTIAHVGDSRVYEIGSNGQIDPLTRDHSLVKRLVELGQLTPDEAVTDPRRNVLYHALGQATPLEPEIISAPLPSSGFLLVCSDGLWGVVSENQINSIIRNNQSLPIACQIMVDAANEAGGPDNITLILIKLSE